MDPDYIKINKYSSIPLHEQLKNCMRDAIQRGILPPGEKLPTEEELCRHLGISRPVVRQAYSALEKEGILERKRGRGSFVKSLDRGMLMMRLASYNDEMNMIGMTPSTRLMKKEILTFELDAYGRLDLQQGQPCLHLERMRYANGEPFTYIENYVPLTLFPGLENYDFATVSLYHILKEDYGTHPVKAQRSIRAEIIDTRLAPLFHVEKRTAIHKVESLAFDQDGRMIDYSLETYPSNTHHFEFQVYSE